MARLPRYTREIVTLAGDKLSVLILPEDNTNVVLKDPALGYAITLDPKAANQYGLAIVKAAQLAAINTLDPTPTHEDTKR